MLYYKEKASTYQITRFFAQRGKKTHFNPQ